MHNDIKNYNTNFIDGTVIANMLNFVYLCPCFDEHGLIELNIGDIQYQDGRIVDVIIKDRNEKTGHRSFSPKLEVELT